MADKQAKESERHENGPPAVRVGGIGVTNLLKRLTRDFDALDQTEQVNIMVQLSKRLKTEQVLEVQKVMRNENLLDFVKFFNSMGIVHIATLVLSKLNPDVLEIAENVSDMWRDVIRHSIVWKTFIASNVKTDQRWAVLGKRRGWVQQVQPNFTMDGLAKDHYHALYRRIKADLYNIQANWTHGNFYARATEAGSEPVAGIYCLQFDEEKIVTGHRNCMVKIWDVKTMQLKRSMNGHEGSVLCLQFEDSLLLTGSSDNSICSWDLTTGRSIFRTIQHVAPVLMLRFNLKSKIMATCSKDRTAIIWSLNSPTDITIRSVLIGHRASINGVGISGNFVVTGSGDRSLKVWEADTGLFLRTLRGHKRGICCMECVPDTVATGGADCTIRIWDLATGFCWRVLRGHEGMIRCICFNASRTRLISSGYDGLIKIWALPRKISVTSMDEIVGVQTFRHDNGRIFSMSTDGVAIVAASQDDELIIWDFFVGQNPSQDDPELPLEVAVQ